MLPSYPFPSGKIPKVFYSFTSQGGPVPASSEQAPTFFLRDKKIKNWWTRKRISVFAERNPTTKNEIFCWERNYRINFSILKRKKADKAVSSLLINLLMPLRLLVLLTGYILVPLMHQLRRRRRRGRIFFKSIFYGAIKIKTPKISSTTLFKNQSGNAAPIPPTSKNFSLSSSSSSLSLSLSISIIPWVP